jgi:hypothetical protein
MKTSYTSKIVRDYPQNASKDGDLITVTAKRGRKKIYSYSFNVEVWRKIPAFGNINYNQREFIEMRVPKAADPKADSLRSRIIDAQISAILHVINE